MNKQVACILIENDGFLVKECEGIRFTKIFPMNIDNIPNIPFYHTAWKYDGKFIKPEIVELRDYINNNYGKISKVSSLVAIPSDSFPVDKRMLEETFQIAGFLGCTMINKTSLLARNGMLNYIALSCSERLVILEWYYNGKRQETVFYNKSAVNRNKLFNDIGNIRYKANDNGLNIFIFDGCNELMELYEIGQPITASEMIEILGDVAKKMANTKKKR